MYFILLNSINKLYVYIVEKLAESLTSFKHVQDLYGVHQEDQVLFIQHQLDTYSMP